MTTQANCGNMDASIMNIRQEQERERERRNLSTGRRLSLLFSRRRNRRTQDRQKDQDRDQEGEEEVKGAITPTTEQEMKNLSPTSKLEILPSSHKDVHGCHPSTLSSNNFKNVPSSKFSARVFHHHDIINDTDDGVTSMDSTQETPSMHVDIPSPLPSPPLAVPQHEDSEEYSPITSASQTRPYQTTTRRYLQLNRSPSSSSFSSSSSYSSPPLLRSPTTAAREEIDTKGDSNNKNNNARHRLFLNHRRRRRRHSRSSKKRTNSNMIPIEIRCHGSSSSSGSSSSNRSDHTNKHRQHHQHHDQTSPPTSSPKSSSSSISSRSERSNSAANNTDKKNMKFCHDDDSLNSNDNNSTTMMNQQFVIFCLDLLESRTKFEDNRVGIERLVVLTNEELVNSKINGGIAEMLIFGGRDGDGDDDDKQDQRGRTRDGGGSTDNRVAARLRSVFPSYLCDLSKIKNRQDGDGLLLSDSDSYGDGDDKCDDDDDDDDDSEEFAIENSKSNDYKCLDVSHSTEETRSFSSSADDPSAIIVKAAHGPRSGSTSSPAGSRSPPSPSSSSPTTMKLRRKMLKLPALRVLVSSLELATRNRRQRVSSSSSLGLTDCHFWKCILSGLVICIEGMDINNNSSTTTATNSNEGPSSISSSTCCMEAFLAVKAVRLLHGLDRQCMEPFIRYSLLPYISNSQHQEKGENITGRRKHLQRPGEKMLNRECDKLLKVLSL